MKTKFHKLQNKDVYSQKMIIFIANKLQKKSEIKGSFFFSLTMEKHL